MSNRVLELVVPCIQFPHAQVQLFAVEVLSVISPRLLRTVGVEPLDPVVALLSEDDDLVATAVARFLYGLSLADEEFFQAMGIGDAVIHRLEAMDTGPCELGGFFVALLLSSPLEESHYRLNIPRFPILTVPAVSAWVVTEIGRGATPEVTEALLSSIIKLFGGGIEELCADETLIREMAAVMEAAAESPDFEGLVAAVFRDDPHGFAGFQKILDITSSISLFRRYLGSFFNAAPGYFSSPG